MILLRVAKGRTTIAMAHHLSTIVDAVTIYVLDEGRPVERGSHASLLRSDGLYAAMRARQQADDTGLHEAAE